MPYQIEQLGKEHFRLTMRDKVAFDHLVGRLNDVFGFSFTQELKLHEPTTENGRFLIEFSDVDQKSLLRHLAVITFP
ncbi:hypothetical protein [Acinetobacter pittii]|uniref:hypothetical protein n=1 Tax=Acinetobacter pittii TaxID=48296 RepID=UPI00397C23D3